MEASDPAKRALSIKITQGVRDFGYRHGVGLAVVLDGETFRKVVVIDGGEADEAYAKALPVLMKWLEEMFPA